MKKTGIVVTYHQNFDQNIVPCLKSLSEFTPRPFYIIAFENNSLHQDKDRVPLLFKKKWYEFWKRNHIDFFSVKDDIKFGGLTGTWNAGIRQCLNKRCDIIVVMNDDIIVNSTWENFVRNITGKTIYGPLSNRPSVSPSCPQTASRNDVSNEIIECHNVNGFCMGFTKEALLNNMVDNHNFFSTASRYAWADNEGEWQRRLVSKGIQPRIIRSAWVYHHKHQSWHARNRYSNSRLPNNVKEQLKHLQQ